MRCGIIRQSVCTLFALLAALAGPATAVAHGVAHAHLVSEHHASARSTDVGTSELRALESTDTDRAHPALHWLGRTTLTLGTSPQEAHVPGTLFEIERECPSVAAAPEGDSPASRLAPPDQPRAPPLG